MTSSIMHQSKLKDLNNKFKWTQLQFKLQLAKSMCINSELIGLQGNIELKWIKCMMNDENRK